MSSPDLSEVYFFSSRMAVFFNTASTPTTVPANSIGTAAFFTNFTIRQNGAFRIVMGSCGNCFNQTYGDKNLTCEGIAISLFDSSFLVPIKAWQGSYSGGKLGIQSGAWASWADDVLVFGTDYMADGSDGVTFSIGIEADVFNSDAVNAHPFVLCGTAAIELYERRPNKMVNQP